jgi:hypothetical protein
MIAAPPGVWAHYVSDNTERRAPVIAFDEDGEALVIGIEGNLVPASHNLAGLPNLRFQFMEYKALTAVPAAPGWTLDGSPVVAFELDTDVFGDNDTHAQVVKSATCDAGEYTYVERVHVGEEYGEGVLRLHGSPASVPAIANGNGSRSRQGGA